MSSSDVSAEESADPPDLSPAQARKLIDGCSDRHKAALKFIARQATASFPYLDLVKAIGEDSSGTIRGTLAAITRRTRTVLSDSEADLIWYDGEEGAYTAKVSGMTRSSLRKAFGLTYQQEKGAGLRCPFLRIANIGRLCHGSTKPAER